MRSSLQATLGRRRNSRALAVSLESLNSSSGKSANRSLHEKEEAVISRVPSTQRVLELIAGDDDFSSPVAKFTPRDRTRTALEGVVKEGRRRGREIGEMGRPGSRSPSEVEDVLSSASTPSASTRVSETNLLRCKETGQVFHLSEGMKMHHLQSSTFLPILENRLYLQASAPAQRDLPGVHFFTWDSAMVKYFPLCADFGPFNLGMTHYFCQFLKDLLADSNHANEKLVLYTSTEDSDITNAIYLVGSFLCLHLGATVEEAWTPFSNIAVNPCMPYCDATWVSPSVYDLHVTDCWAGLLKAVKMGLYSPSDFNHEEYLYYDDPGNGDMHEVVPGKFLAFKGPTEERKPLGTGHFSFLPTDYGAVFEVKGVRTIVRLTEEKAYDREWLVNQGFHLQDLAVPEGATPSEAVVDKFLKIAEASKAPIAVHCESGLGPTPTLIGMYMMKHLDFTADEAIAWLRICRPGSVIGPQQRFLEQQEQHMRSLGMIHVSGLGLEDHEVAVADSTADDEAAVAGAPDHGARFGAALAMEIASALRKGMEARDQARLSKVSCAENDDNLNEAPAAAARPGEPQPAAPDANATHSRGRSTLASETPRRRRPSSASAAERSTGHDSSSMATGSGPNLNRLAEPQGGASGCKCKALKRPACTCSNLNLRVGRAKLSMLRQWTSESAGLGCELAGSGSTSSTSPSQANGSESLASTGQAEIRQPHPPSTPSLSGSFKARFTGRARANAGAGAAQLETASLRASTNSVTVGSRREAAEGGAGIVRASLPEGGGARGQTTGTWLEQARSVYGQ